MAEKGKLNLQMEMFVQEMLKDSRNQRQAAINAGYSMKTATQKAAGLMNLPKVAARIEVLTTCCCRRRTLAGRTADRRHCQFHA